MPGALNAVRKAIPATYWRVRNALALGELYAPRAWRRVHGAEPYDEAFWDSHDIGDWEGFARVVIDAVHPRSVVDIGCGHGLALQGFARVDPTLRLHGFDDSDAALARARARGLAVDRIDFVALSRREAAVLARDLACYDAVICLEVAEHLPPWHNDKLLTVVTAGKRLIFSAAHPLQGGRLHVNERPAEYWMARLGERGFVVSRDDEAFRRAVAALDLPPWYHQNVHLFEPKTLG